MRKPRVDLDATLSRMDYGRVLKGELLMEPRHEAFVPYAQPLLDAVHLFESLSIGYAVIGGIAAMYYGRARFTEDVDFVADDGHMNVLAAHPSELAEHHFDPVCTFKLYHQSGVQVDIWKDEHAREIVARAASVTLAGRLIRMIAPNDLVAMKLRARRPKDDYDVSEMIAAGAVDEFVLRPLVSRAELDYFHQIKSRLAGPVRP